MFGGGSGSGHGVAVRRGADWGSLWHAIAFRPCFDALLVRLFWGGREDLGRCLRLFRRTRRSQGRGLRIAEKSRRRAGVTVNGGRCVEPWNPAQIVMNILPEAMAQRIARNPRQLGHSIMAGSGKFGSTGYIFRDRIAKVAEAVAIPEAVLFGNVLTHEIGHLPLGDDSHSPAGLMRAAWAAADFEAMLRNGLMFETGKA